MSEILIIASMSAVIWFLIDRAKPLWSNYSYGKYITLLASFVLSTAVVLSYNIDLIFALELNSEVSIIGKVLTILAMMSGASGVSEIISLIKDKH